MALIAAGFNNALQAIEQAGQALTLKRLRVELSREEFVCVLKRYSVTLSAPAFGLEGASSPFPESRGPRAVP